MPHTKITQTYVDGLPYQDSGTLWVHDTELAGFNLSIGQRTKTYYAAGEHGNLFDVGGNSSNRKTRRKGQETMNVRSALIHVHVAPKMEMAEGIRMNEFNAIFSRRWLPIKRAGCSKTLCGE